MRNKILLFSLVILVLLSACGGGPAAKPQAVTQIRLPMGYVPNVQYAPFYVADAKGYFKEAGLEVTFDYSSETDGMALVGANEIQFSLASGEQAPLARAAGLPVVYVFAWWRDYPVAVAALKDQGIRTPADLKGKKIGLPGLYGANYIGLIALLNNAGLKEEDVTLDSIGYNQVEALVSGRVDAVVIYANNEPIQLARQGYEVDVIRVADYVHLVSNGLVTNETTIAQNPDLVERMTQAVLRGVASTINNPDEAFTICTQYVEGLTGEQQVVQREIMQASIEFWKAEKLGVSDQQAWENMQAVLLDMGLLKQPLDLSKAFTNEFILKK